eukprot:gene12736-15060_t
MFWMYHCSEAPKPSQMSADKQAVVLEDDWWCRLVDAECTVSAANSVYSFRLACTAFSVSSTAVSVTRFARTCANMVAYGTADGSIVVGRIVPGEKSMVLHTAHAHTRRITDLDWSPSDAYLLSCSLDGSTRVWQLKGDAATAPAGAPPEAQSASADKLDPAEEADAASGCSVKRRAAASAAETSGTEQNSRADCFSTATVTCGRFHPTNNELLVVGNATGEVAVLQVSTGRQVASFRVGAAICSLEVMLGGSLAFVGDAAGQLHVFQCNGRCGTLSRLLRVSSSALMGQLGRVDVANRSPIIGIEQCSWSPIARGPALLVSHRDGTVYLYALIHAPAVQCIRVAHLQLPRTGRDLPASLCPVVAYDGAAEYVAVGRENGSFSILDAHDRARSVASLQNDSDVDIVEGTYPSGDENVGEEEASDEDCMPL